MLKDKNRFSLVLYKDEFIAAQEDRGSISMMRSALSKHRKLMFAEFQLYIKEKEKELEELLNSN